MNGDCRECVSRSFMVESRRWLSRGMLTMRVTVVTLTTIRGTERPAACRNLTIIGNVQCVSECESTVQASFSDKPSHCKGLVLILAGRLGPVQDLPLSGGESSENGQRPLMGSNLVEGASKGKQPREQTTGSSILYAKVQYHHSELPFSKKSE